MGGRTPAQAIRSETSRPGSKPGCSRRREVTLHAKRASVAARGRQIDTEVAPIRYVAELVGADTDSERAIRWLIAVMVVRCGPLAIALTAAASA